MIIEKLHKRLLEEGIPHEFVNRSEGTLCPIIGYQIWYPSKEDNIGDFIQIFGTTMEGRLEGYSYGADLDLMEAMGFDITPEKDGGTVKGYISLDEAYEMIKKEEEKRAAALESC